MPHNESMQKAHTTTKWRQAKDLRVADVLTDGGLVRAIDYPQGDPEMIVVTVFHADTGVTEAVWFHYEDAVAVEAPEWPQGPFGGLR